MKLYSHSRGGYNYVQSYPPLDIHYNYLASSNPLSFNNATCFVKLYHDNYNGLYYNIWFVENGNRKYVLASSYKNKQVLIAPTIREFLL